MTNMCINTKNKNHYAMYLWVIAIVINLNYGAVTSQLIGNILNRSRQRQSSFTTERNDRQFPFVNNPGQFILDRIKTNLDNTNPKFSFQGGLNVNLGNLGNLANNNIKNFAQQAFQNTVNIVNKTLGNFGQSPFENLGNMGNITPQQYTTQPSISINNSHQNQQHTSVTPTVSVNTLVTSTEKVQENPKNKNIPGIDKDFPVIDLNPKDIRR